MPIPDVLIVGAGPAGATAALVLARAGARVTLLDRARFPRDKLCGDTLNPGTLRALRRLGIEEDVTRGGVRLEGMRLTGPSGARVDGRYPNGIAGLALPRREFDLRLLEAAAAAGAELGEGVKVDAPLVESGQQSGVRIAGVRARSTSGPCDRRAHVTIAADGRASTIVSALGLARRPAFPARWAIGAYFEDVAGLEALGEMHVRAGHYIGVAPMPCGTANTVLVVPRGGARHSEVPLTKVLAHVLAHDPQLASRFSAAKQVSPTAVLGPMAVDVRPFDGAGLLVAGDAAGFIDPMTGDGMRFAVVGGQLAAVAALEALERGWPGVQQRHQARRRRVFGHKRAFNKAMRRVTSSAVAVRALDACAPLLSALFARVICYAGDVRLVD